MNPSRKYCRSLHAQISLGTTSDDRFMPKGYVTAFAKMEGLVLTEKLDGQNNCFNKFGLFARSHTAPTTHPWDKPLLERWKILKNELGDLEVFGENMYGIHSIEYSKLESFFYVFAIREGDYWLSWEEVKWYAAMLDFPTVPELPISITLQDFFEQKKNLDENECLEKWLEINLKMPWTAYVNSAGLLGGQDPKTKEECAEGFVIRNKNGFQTNEGNLTVAPNEFNNLFKLVREAHVKTDVHWTKNWRPAKLCNYQKYNWHNYNFRRNK